MISKNSVTDNMTRSTIEGNNVCFPHCHEINVRITKVCNMNCNFCLVLNSNLNHNDEKFIKLDVLKSIVYKYEKSNKNVFCFGSREPFTHPDIENIIKIVLDHGCQVMIQNNGSLIMNHKNFFKSLPYNLMKLVNIQVSYNNELARQIQNINENALQIFDFITNLGGKFELTAMLSETLLDDNKEFIVSNFGLDNYIMYYDRRCPKMDLSTIELWSKVLFLSKKEFYNIDGTKSRDFIESLLYFNNIHKTKLSQLTEEEKKLL